MPQMPAIRGRMTPLFWGGGVALVLAIMRPFERRMGGFKLNNHRGMSQIDEYGCGRPERKPMPHPPHNPVASYQWPFGA